MRRKGDHEAEPDHQAQEGGERAPPTSKRTSTQRKRKGSTPTTETDSVETTAPFLTVACVEHALEHGAALRKVLLMAERYLAAATSAESTACMAAAPLPSHLALIGRRGFDL